MFIRTLPWNPTEIYNIIYNGDASNLYFSLPQQFLQIKVCFILGWQFTIRWKSQMFAFTLGTHFLSQVIIMKLIELISPEICFEEKNKQ